MNTDHRRNYVGRLESMMEDKFWSFKDPSFREYDTWLQNNDIRKIGWREGFREHFNLEFVEGRVCIKNPMARLRATLGPLLLVPTDFMMKALVLGELP